jgi:hypothetical protein
LENGHVPSLLRRADDRLAVRPGAVNEDAAAFGEELHGAGIDRVFLREGVMGRGLDLAPGKRGTVDVSWNVSRLSVCRKSLPSPAVASAPD